MARFGSRSAGQRLAIGCFLAPGLLGLLLVGFGLLTPGGPDGGNAIVALIGAGAVAFSAALLLLFRLYLADPREPPGAATDPADGHAGSEPPAA
jgi:hypothetical protein